MRAKEVMAVILSAAMLMSMTACSNSSTGDDATVTTTTTVAATEKTTTTGAVESTTPEETTPVETTVSKSEGELLAEKYTGFIETPMDLGGRTIRLVSDQSNRYVYAKDAAGNPDPDNTSNETIEIVEAIKSIEKDYNCTIEIEQLKGKSLITALLTEQAAGNAYCDILEFGCSSTYLEQIYGASLCMDLNDPRVADIIKLDVNPWLPASNFGLWVGAQYGVHFKTNNSPDLLRGVMLFNKDLAAQYGLGDIYELYRNKEWTFDKLTEMCAKVMAQSDGTVYPLMYNQEGLWMPMLIYANGGSMAAYEDSKFKFTGLTDNTLEAVNYAVDWKQKGYLHPKSEARSENEVNFANGEAIFFVANYAALKKYTQGKIECNYEIGLLPGPMGPHGNGEYNAVSYTEAMFNIMDNVEKPEEVAAVLVALANRTGKHDMIETELMYTLQDEESAETLQLMYDNMVCDYSRSISTTRGVVSGACKSIMNLEKTPKEAYEEIASKVQAYFDEYNTTGKITKVEE